MVSGDERRKSVREAVPAEFYFNILNSPKEYIRGQASILKRLKAVDAVKAPQPRTESQFFLARIDQKLSLLVTLMADTSGRKNYANQATVVDISECGLSFIYAQPFEKGTVLEIGLQLPMGEKTRIMDIAGTIVHVQNSPEPGEESKTIYGVEFSDILGKDQNDIMQWIFAHQREQIRRRREKESL
jgi:hypothetical protein